MIEPQNKSVMNVSLTPEFAKFIAAQVKLGCYQTSSEVVRDGLRLLKEQNELHRRRVSELQQALALGDKDFEEGRWRYGDEVRAERLHKRAARKRKKA
jgi:antitoxin ParD1/3/4